MKGNMQDWAPNVADIIEHASQQFPKREVISKTQSGQLHRTNYRQVCIRAKKLASALERDGYKRPIKINITPMSIKIFVILDALALS